MKRKTRKRLPNCEQETIIGKTREEKEWRIYSCDETFKTRLARVLKRMSRKWKKIDEYGVECTLPPGCIRINPPRELSEEEREVRSERMKTMRQVQEGASSLEK